MQRRLFVLVLGLSVLAVTTLRAQISCPTMPDPVTQVNRDVHSDVQAGVGSLGKLKAGDARVETDVVANNLFGKYPNVDKLLIVQMMAATYCSMIRDKTTEESNKLLLWSQFSQRIFRFTNPQYSSALAREKTPVLPKLVDRKQTLLTDIQDFSNKRRLAETASYGWQQYMDDAGVLYRRAMDFSDLLRRSNPKYQDVSSIYAAFDEATDELSLRGRVMHDSGHVPSANYDTHIFVGPGWFHLSLQELRRVHEENTTLTGREIATFSSDVEYWKLCWSGTQQSSPNCK